MTSWCRSPRRLRAVVAMVSGLLAVRGASAQTPPQRTPVPAPAAVDSLVLRAIARRGLQLADSTLLSYRATAKGYLAFLGQLGDGTLLPPKVVQSEELALTIAWWQPDRSAQQLVGRRDTTLLPARVGYYRDRYGVVLDNLADRIRLGDGMDVRDVPHPLGPDAPALYRYTRGTPVTIRLAGREIVVDEVRFEPRDASRPAAVGSVYLDRETAAVVRLSMTFTRAALIDRRIERLVVTLENGLIRERYWLPRRQEVEVVRRATWLDIPARGIVRGHWEVSGYDVNERIPDEVRALPRWSTVPAESLRAHPFADRIVDHLPVELQVANTEDVAQARAMAEAAVSAALLARPARPMASGRGISDLARHTRAEGLAVGFGLSQRLPGALGGWQVAARARHGFGDQQLKGALALVRVPALGGAPLLQLFAEREYRDLGLPERGGVTNSLGSLLLGSDYTTQVDTRALGVTMRRSALDPWQTRVAYEWDAPVPQVAPPLGGRYIPSLAAWRLQGVRVDVRGRGGWVPGADGHRSRGSWLLEAAAGSLHGTRADGEAVRPTLARVQGSLIVERPLPHDRALVGMLHGGAAFGTPLAPQWHVFAGGPYTAPGYGFQSFAGAAFLSPRAELRLPVPAPRIPLGRYGTAPGRVVLAPYVQATAFLAREAPLLATRASGVWPSVGLGALTFFDLLRLDVARGVRDGSWRFAVDIDRGFWGVM
jgi:hypothetical protein